MKKVLVIGGTQFVGRNLVEHLIASNQYDITLFNRGKTNQDLFPNLRLIKGDRNTDDILKICEENWDIIFDVSCYFPISLEILLPRLKDKVKKYIYVSTASLYNISPSTPYMDESTEIVSFTEEDKTDTSIQTYNQRKAACEKILLEQEWLDKIIFRLGLVIGKYDHTDRLYYWFHKLQTQDKFLIPNNGKNIISYSDVSDLSKVLMKAIDVKNKFIIYNANSYNASLFDFISRAKKTLNKDSTLINITPEQFNEHELKAWTDLPLWIDGDFFTMNNTRLKSEFPIPWNSIDQTTHLLLDYYSNYLEWRKPETSQPSLSPEKENQIINSILN